MGGGEDFGHVQMAAAILKVLSFVIQATDQPRDSMFCHGLDTRNAIKTGGPGATLQYISIYLYTRGERGTFWASRSAARKEGKADEHGRRREIRGAGSCSGGTSDATSKDR